MRATFLFFSLVLSATCLAQKPASWIRINLLGYKPGSVKVAVWCTKEKILPSTFQLVDAVTNKIVFEKKIDRFYGEYGPFAETSRLDFSFYRTPGKYFLKVGETTSPAFPISDQAYNGTADFSLQYMRQQRSGYNPFLKDSCHTQDGYAMYGPMPDSTHVDVSGGWHDATDYLQYAMTSANATYHLLAAYRDFPKVFNDRHQANGLEGETKIADVLDEAAWGTDWLLKMHPRADWMFNQLADDRDHAGFRLPTKDKVSYGKGLERPVYFVTGEPQGLGKHKNRSTGTSSTAGKFSSAFSLAYQLLPENTRRTKSILKERALSAYAFGQRKYGHTQTASYREPYFYEEDNWVDDMELAAAQLYSVTGNQDYLTQAFAFAQKEKQTPWLGRDTASHYQWYPFINLGHEAIARSASGEMKSQAIKFYKDGIEKVWLKAKGNAFFRGVPFIWCSNNLQTSFAIQCYWYRVLSGDNRYEELEQASFDWLLGCNPWGTSMIVGMPAHGDFPDDPHSSLNFLHGYQTLGALVDGPVYGSIYKQQRGVKIMRGDEYDEFQSNKVVYHDDYGDYVTNEPTMDGTASLVYLLAAKENEPHSKHIFSQGAIVRGNPAEKQIAIVFTGHEYADGGEKILSTLKEHNSKASFFFTGDFYRQNGFSSLIKKIKKEKHYLGPHSDRHLLYCDWTNRDSLLVSRVQFENDLSENYRAMQKFGVKKEDARYFIPPYEWYNNNIANWTRASGAQLINYSTGTLSTADYTTPEMKNYRSSDAIFNSIVSRESEDPNGLNGFILLLHIGTDPKRTDKFYNHLDELLTFLKNKGYHLKTVDELLSN